MIKSIILDVPYKSQLDNRNEPFKTCNVTSLAMCFEYLGKEPAGDGQLEDELFDYGEAQGYNIYSPDDLAQIVRDYGLKDDYKSDATIDELRDWLIGGNPAVIHGFFTDAGHIVTVVGFDDTGLYVHDPYGEYFDDGYRTDLSGEYLHYSYDLIRRTCQPDGDFWVHFISA